MIPAKVWRTMTNEGILSSLEIAINILNQRQLAPDDKRQLIAIAREILGAILRG